MAACRPGEVTETVSGKSLPAGTRIDRYELRNLAGEGGMGNVYGAVDTKIGGTVAVKVLAAPADGKPPSDKLRQRFLREVLTISRIDHPNVIKVRDYGFTEDGTPYLVMDFLHGKDLGSLLREKKEPLAIDHAVDIMLEVCAAIRACHEMSVVHRDLKPGNIFLATSEAGGGWQVKVVDFGVSKAPIPGNLTDNGQIIGTWQYLSPEQVNGQAGPESDQYAIGVLLYVCLTKRLPYGGLKNIALLKAIDKGEFTSPRTYRPEIPEGLEEVILKAMHVSPAQRFESVYALGQRLWEFGSPLGRETWKNFYVRSPVPPALPRQFAVGLPSEIMKTLQQRGLEEEGGPDDAPTALARYHATTVPGQASTLGDSASRVELAPTKQLSMSTSADSFGFGPTAPSGDTDPSRADDVHAETVLPPVASDRTGDLPSRWTRRRKAILGFSAAGVAVAASLLLLGASRSDERLIRPAFPPPTSTDRAVAPLPPSGVPAPAATTPAAEQPQTARQAAAPSPAAQVAVPPAVPSHDVAPHRKKHRARTGGPAEVTPDGVPLLP